MWRVFLLIEDVQAQCTHKAVRLKKALRIDCQLLQASPLIRKFAQQMVEAARGHPMVDVACGSGRNAIYLAQLGCSVICLDRDTSRFRSDFVATSILKRLKLIQMDLLADPWPFSQQTTGGIVLVDFLHVSLFPKFHSCLIKGGYVLIETVSARGGNYLELPKAGELRAAFDASFNFCFYREHKAGPPEVDAVAVKMLAMRR